MNQVKSDNIVSLPFKYKQFIAKKEKGWDSYFFRIKQTFTFNRFLPMRDQPVFQVDHLIVGSNMLLNLVLLYKISEKNLNNPTNIGIYSPKELDYWAYDIIVDNEIFKKIQSNTQFKDCEKIEELIELMVNSIKKTKIKVFLLDERFRINYVEYDNNNNKSFFWFDNEKNNVVKNEKFIEENNKIKLFTNETIINFLEKGVFFNKVIWNFKNNFQKYKEVNSEKKYALAIAEYVYITSLPQGWLSLKNDIREDRVCFNAENSYKLFGTSKVIFFEQNAMQNYCKKELTGLIVNGLEKSCHHKS